MSLILVEKWTWCIEFTKRDLMVWQSWCLDGSMNYVICMGEVVNYIPQSPSSYHCKLKVMSRGKCMRFGREKWRSHDNHICTDRRQRCIVTQWAWVTAYSSDTWVCRSGMAPTKHTFDVSSLLGSRFHRLFQELPQHGHSLVFRFKEILVFSCSFLMSNRPLLQVIELSDFLSSCHLLHLQCCP